MFMVVDYGRKMTVKKSCKYDGYGSFEHLVFLLKTLEDLKMPINFYQLSEKHK